MQKAKRAKNHLILIIDGEYGTYRIFLKPRFNDKIQIWVLKNNFT